MRWIKRWFWSPVRDGENWAQTLVRVSGNLLRSVFTVGVLFIGVGVAVAYAYSHYETAQRESERAKLVVTVNHRDQNKFAKDFCTADFPIVIYVRNETAKALVSMEIELIGRERGSSTNKIDYSARRIDWDNVVPPNHMLTMCYSLPQRYAA